MGETCSQFEGDSTNFGDNLKEVMRGNKRGANPSNRNSSKLDNNEHPKLAMTLVPKGSFSLKSKVPLRKIPSKPEIRQSLCMRPMSLRTMNRTSSIGKITSSVQDRGKRKARHRRSTIIRQS